MAACFAGATFLFLAFLILQSASNPQLVCNIFPIFILFFSFSLGLASAFIGGVAAANGQLGEQAQGHYIQYSAGGGIAVVIISIFVLNFFAPDPESDRCKLTRIDQSITITDIPKNVKFWKLDNWSKRERSDPNIENEDHEILLYSNKSNHIRMRIAVNDDTNTIKTCEFFVHTVSGIKKKTEMAKFIGEPFDPDQFEMFEMPGARGSIIKNYVFEYDGQNSLEDDGSGAGLSCIKASNENVKAVFYSFDTDKVLSTHLNYAVLDIDVVSEDNNGFWPFRRVRPWFQNIIASASAEQLRIGMPYSELKLGLENADAETRIVARELLGETFDAYATEGVADIFGSGSQSDLVTSLLHGLSAGIDSETEEALSPGKKRDLTRGLPFVEGRELDLVRLTGHADESVRKQARRVIQRYPVDAFGAIYADLGGDIQAGECNVLKVAFPDGILQGLVFYEYNRIIEEIYQGRTLQEADFARIDGRAEKVKSLVAKCVTTKSILVDSAVLDYGRSIAYAGSSPLRSKDAARVFNEHVEGREQQYYFQQHVRRMKDMVS